MSTLPRRCVQCKTLIAKGSRCAKCTPPKGNTTQRGYGAAWAKLSKQIIRRDRGVCYWCGGPADTTDHLVPKSCGGTDDPTNLVASCRTCNGRKGNRDFLSQVHS